MLHSQHRYPKQSTPIKNRHDDCVCLSASYLRYRVVGCPGIFIQWSDWNELCRSRLDQDGKLLTSHCLPFVTPFLFLHIQEFSPRRTVSDWIFHGYAWCSFAGSIISVMLSALFSAKTLGGCTSIYWH